MALESGRCIQCGPEYCSGAEECWRFGIASESASADLCMYASYDACIEINGPGSTYVDPDRCLVFFVGFEMYSILSTNHKTNPHS